MSNNTTERVLRLVRPELGQHIALQIQDADSKIVLGFEPGTAVMAKDGQALVFTFDDGSSIRIEGFYDTYSQDNLPSFVVNETELDAATFFAAQEELMPAAGASVAASGGRFNELGTSDLIGGNAALDGLDPGQNPEISPESLLLGSAEVFSGDSPGEGPGGGPGGEGSPRGIDYSARAVLYAKDGGTALTLQGVTVTEYEWVDEAYAAYFDVSVDQQGLLSLTLKPGLTLPEELASNLYSYLKITTPEGTYTVQVVVNQSDSINSRHENSNDAVSGGSLTGGSTVQYEWMQGTNMTATAADSHILSTSGLKDQVAFTGGMQADVGNNTIIADTSVGSQADILLGAPTAEAAMAADNGGSNAVRGGEGVTNVTLSGVNGMDAANSGANSISGAKGSVLVNGNATAMNAVSGGSNTISDIDGSVKLVGKNGMDTAGSGSSNTITQVSGDVTVQATDSGMGGNRTSGGANTISHVDGNVTLATGSGIAMNAWYNNQNTISDVKGNVNMSGKEGMYAFGAGAKNAVNTVDGTVIVNASDGDAMGAWNSAAENSISNVAKDVILNGTDTGMNAVYGGKNTVSNVGGDVTVKGQTFGMIGAIGQNTISNVGGNVTVQGHIVADLKGGNLIEKVQKDVLVNGGLSVQNKDGENIIREVRGNVTVQSGISAGSGQNSITGVDGVVTVNNAGTAVSAAGGAANSISAAGNVNITGNNPSGVATGLRASGAGSSNIVASGSDVNLIAKSTSSGAIAMDASGANAQNSLAADGKVSVRAESERGSAAGINNSAGAVTTIEGGKGVEVVAKGGTSGQGIWNLSTTTLLAHSGNVVVDAQTTNSGEARGVHTGGTTRLTAENGDVKVLASGSKASGVYTISTGTTTLQASGLVDVQARATGAGAGDKTSGLYSESQNSGQLAHNILAGGSVNIEARANSGNVYAMHTNTGQNTVQSDSTAVVKATADAGAPGNTYAMYATSTNNKFGNNSITARDVTLESQGGKNAYGMAAEGSKGANTNAIEASGKTSIAVSGDTAYGMFAKGAASENSIGKTTASGDVSVNSESTASIYGAYGLNALDGGKNTINSAGLIDIQATGKQSVAYGVNNSIGDTSVGGHNLITTSATDRDGLSAIRIAAQDGVAGSPAAGQGSITAVGLSSYRGSNTVNAQNGTVEISAESSRGGGVAGVWTQYGTNTVSGQNVVINAHTTNVDDTGKSSTTTFIAATGMSAGLGGQNVVHVGESFTMDVQTDSVKDIAAGMFATSNSKNIIQAATSGAGIEVRITVAAGDGAKAYAMYASGTGAENIINGSANADNTIRLDGNIYAASGGKNIIRTSGTGTNLIEVDGAVTRDGLTLETKGDYDVLILKAADINEFNARFSTWLKNLGNAADIEKVEVYLDNYPNGDADLRALGLGWLLDKFGAGKVDNVSHDDYKAHFADAPVPSADTADTQGVSPAAFSAAMADEGQAATPDSAQTDSAGQASAFSSLAGQQEPSAHVPDTQPAHDEGGSYGVDSLTEQAQANPAADDSFHFGAAADDYVLAEAGTELPAPAPAESPESLVGSVPEIVAEAPVEHADWILPEGGYGEASLVLQLDNVADFSSSFEQMQVPGVESLWIDLGNGSPDSIDASFLDLAFKADTDIKEVRLLHDQSDTINMADLQSKGWVDTGHVETYSGNDDNSINFAVFTNADDESLKLFIELSGGLG